MFLEKKIENNIFDKLLNITNNLDFEKYRCKEKTCTINGYQSVNIVKLFDKNILKETLDYKDFYKHVFHIHFIEYERNGYQEIHNHVHSEKYSFIIYLNDSDGITKFYNVKGKDIQIKPETAKLILFSSDINHEAFISNKYKKILVGAIFKK